MKTLVLHHLKTEELPTEWTKQLPVGQYFTITITPEESQQIETKNVDNVPPLFGIWKDRAETQQDVDAYVRQLRTGRFDVD